MLKFLEIFRLKHVILIRVKANSHLSNVVLVGSTVGHAFTLLINSLLHEAALNSMKGREMAWKPDGHAVTPISIK